MSLHLKFLWIVCIAIGIATVYSKECSPSESVCEYWLTIDERLTMTWKNVRVVAENGSLFKFNDVAKEAPVPMEEVITMDGYHRSVIAVNNTIPGPPIIVYEGQRLIIHVRNHLLSESITIHWHGLHQRNTPFMDGVAFITQCPIGPGQKFSYDFKAYPQGTFWYHSHIGGQRVDGLYGALIIKTKNNPANDIEDKIMHVSGWFHAHSSELHGKMIYANFKSQPGFVHPKTLDGVFFAPLIYKSTLIEGRGRYKDEHTGKWLQPPLMTYNVIQGKKYRFRVIGSGMIYPYRVSIDNHILTVVASDGFEVEARNFESIIINPGERFDFIITANQTVGDYWIRADGMDVDFTDHYGKAILRYDASSTKEPATNRTECTAAKKCDVLNCQFSYYPKESNTQCVRIDQLSSKGGEKIPAFEGSSKEYFLNFVQGGGMNINGKVFEHPGVSSLTQSEDVDVHLNCDQASCGVDKICYCQHEIDIPYDKTIQMVWTNHGKGATRHHPIHLHGHSFHVLKMGYGGYNSTTGQLLSQNRDIDCGGTPKNFCNNPTWKNKSWTNGNVPGLNLVNPPQKDTLMIPTGAYAVIRFRSNNPGKWFLHCHIEFHSMQGMAMTINEAQEKHVEPPKGFPICQHFRNDPNLDVEYTKYVPNADDDDDKERNLLIIIVVLAVILVLENIILSRYCCLTRQRKNNVKTNEVVMKNISS